MKLTTAHYLNHSGTNYEIGQHLGRWILATPEAARRLQAPPGIFPVRTQEKKSPQCLKCLISIVPVSIKR